MKSFINRSVIIQQLSKLNRFSKNSLSMHILPVVFALMFVMIIHRSSDQPGSDASSKTVAATETSAKLFIPDAAKFIRVAGASSTAAAMLLFKATVLIARIAGK